MGRFADLVDAAHLSCGHFQAKEANLSGQEDVSAIMVLLLRPSLLEQLDERLLF